MGIARRIAAIPSVRAATIDAVVLTTLTTGIAAIYAWTRAPLYNPFGTIDPWLYTAVWTNFDQIYESFSGSYYLSRVPWIVPGYLLNGIFDARPAFIVLHSVYFLAGGVLFYVLCRRWLGAPAAAMGYVALVGCQMYFNAHRWDYPDGGVFTYMIGAYTFSLVRTRSPLLRATSLALGGVFAAAMVATRVSEVIYLVGIPLLYIAVGREVLWAAWLRQFIRDLGAFALGAAVLLVACGLFARAHGGEFLFFMPQVRVVESTTWPINHLPVDKWLPFSPYFWVPLFVIAIAAVILAVGPRDDRLARRVAAAAALWLTLLYGLLCLWQFFGDGWFLNHINYFSPLLIPTVFCLTAAMAVVVGDRIFVGRSIFAVVACSAAVFGATLWIYRSDAVVRAATDYTSHAYLAMFLVMGAAIVLAVLVRLPGLRALAAVTTVAASFFAVNFGINASVPTLTLGTSNQRTGGLYDVGQKFIGYLHANGYEKALPATWYDASDVASGVASIQSLYYYALTYLDTGMPAVSDTFKYRMSYWQPQRIVLLCGEPGCKGAATALGRAGYKPWVQSQTLLESEGVRVWVRILSVDPTP